MFSLNVPAKYSDTVYGTLRPLYISSRLFGYSPFSATTTKPSANKIYLTKVDHLIFMIHVVAYTLCIVLNFDVEIVSDLSTSRLLVNGVKFQMVLGCICSFVKIVVEYMFKTSYWNIIESLNDFDLKFLTLDKTIDHSKHKKLLKHYMILWFLLYSTFSIYSVVISLQYSELFTVLQFMISYALINGTYGTASTCYSFLILSVKLRFEALNDCLRELFQPVKVIDYNNEETSRNKIVKMAQLHDKLTDIMESVNRRFSIQVMGRYTFHQAIVSFCHVGGAITCFIADTKQIPSPIDVNNQCPIY